LWTTATLLVCANCLYLALGPSWGVSSVPFLRAEVKEKASRTMLFIKEILKISVEAIDILLWMVYSVHNMWKEASLCRHIV
jgi:hypothetical protein